MSMIQLQITLLDAVSTVAQLGTNWLVQSTALLTAGLLIGTGLRRWGSATQSAVYRATLLAVVACPLTTIAFSAAGMNGWTFQLPRVFHYRQITAPPEPAAVSALPVSNGVAAHLAAARQSADSVQLPPRTDAKPADTTQPHPDKPSSLSTAMAQPAPPGDSLARHRPAAPASGVSVTRTSPAETWLFELTAFGLVVLAGCLLWAAVSGILLIRLARALYGVKRLRTLAAPVEVEVQRACAKIAESLGVRAPQVRRTPCLPSPCVAGWLRPFVLLPEGSSAGRDVLIHEIAHVRRHDCTWNLLRRLVECVLFFQPLLYVLTRRLEAAAEEVCDDYVVQLAGDRVEYARTLLNVAELNGVPLRAVTVGVVSRRSVLAVRVARVLDASRPVTTQACRSALFLIVMGSLAGTALAGFVGANPQPDENDSANGPQARATAENAVSREPSGTSSTPSPSDRGTVHFGVGVNSDAGVTGHIMLEENDETDAVPLRGRVLSAEQTPVAGAQLYWLRWRVRETAPEPPRLVATTNAAGEFEIQPPPPDTAAKSRDGWRPMTEQLVLLAEGHAFKLLWPGSLRTESTVTLPTAGAPIRGRFTDPQGRPVAGATVKIRWFNDPGRRWNRADEAQARGVENAPWQTRTADLLGVVKPVALRELLPSATTDNDGRFELHGVGAQRLVQLLVQGPGVASADLIVHNEPGEPIVLPGDRHDPHGSTRTILPREFTHTIAPSRPIEGRVTDFDTGAPIANAVVQTFHVHGIRLSSTSEREHFAARTDADGRYRITGLPIGPHNRLVAYTTGDEPYVAVGHEVDTSANATAPSVSQDFRLKRGVWAEGRVYDAETDAPLTGSIHYYFFRDPDLDAALPGLRRAFMQDVYWTDANGAFRLPVLRTRGILAYRYDGDGRNRDRIDRFPSGYGASEIEGAQQLGGSTVFPTDPHYLVPSNYQRLAEVHPEADSQNVRVDMPLQAASPVQVRVTNTDGIPLFVDDEGNPAMRLLAHGISSRPTWQTVQGPEFEIVDLPPGERRNVFVYHAETNLAGGVRVTGRAKDDVEVRLVRSGSAEGRIVDTEGNPIADASISPSLSQASAVWAPHPKLRSMPTRIPVDEQGRFRIEGLVPGWNYHATVSAPRPFQGQKVNITLGTVFENVQVEPGEHKELGDLVVQDVAK